MPNLPLFSAHSAETPLRLGMQIGLGMQARPKGLTQLLFVKAFNELLDIVCCEKEGVGRGGDSPLAVASPWRGWAGGFRLDCSLVKWPARRLSMDAATVEWTQKGIWFPHSLLNESPLAPSPPKSESV